MSGFAPRRLALLAAALVAALIPSGAVHAGGPGKWTKLSNGTGSSLYQVGLLRTADGKLHVVWPKRLKSGRMTYGTSTISQAGKLGATGSALSAWDTLSESPRLVPNGKSLRLIFYGSQNSNGGNPYRLGAVYTETSATGSSWNLVLGSMSSHTVLNDGLGATTQKGGQPVAAFGLNDNLYWHFGVDSSIPAATPDSSITGQTNSGLEDVDLARNKDGSIWMAWFQLFQSKRGYWVDEIAPEGTAKKVPGGGIASISNDPGQQVAFAARVGGGLYLAYCSPTKTKQCAHVDLWKVGTSSPKIVPGTSNGNARHVALESGPSGRMWIAWIDTGSGVIHAVRTNRAVTRFGPLRNIKPPPNTADIYDLQTEGSSGRLDIIVNDLQFSSVEAFWHTQVLQGLSLSASPRKMSHTHATTVTFTVTDSGDPVQGAKVRVVGRSDMTNSSGIAKITIPKGTSVGKHIAIASKTGYNSARTVIRVT